MSIVYLNGEYLPVEAARVSVLDRGFTFGDSVYEVIPVYGEHVFRLDEHLTRLYNSLRAINMENPRSVEQWQDIFRTVLDKNQLAADRSLYVQVTRGVSTRDHLDDQGLTATVFVMCRPVVQRDFSLGVSAITHEDIRWQYCHIKATTLLANVLLKQRARKAGDAVEAILVKSGRITEGASSNVFVVIDGVVLTPEKDGSVLPGITRDLVVELLHHDGLACFEKLVTLEGMRAADEVWLTSSTLGIMPVVSIDGGPVADGRPGPVWQRANALYQHFKTDPAMLKRGNIGGSGAAVRAPGL